MGHTSIPIWKRRRMQLQRDFIYDPINGSLRITKKGKQHLGRLFRRFGISISGITSVEKLNQAVTRLPERYQQWIGRSLIEADLADDTLLERFELSVITKDDEAFPELLRKLAHRCDN